MTALTPQPDPDWIVALLRFVVVTGGSVVRSLQRWWRRMLTATLAAGLCASSATTTACAFARVCAAGVLAGCGDDAAEPLAPGAANTTTAPAPLPPVTGTAVADDEGAPAPLGPPYPVILVHGFSGWHDVAGGVGYFYGVVDDFRARGVDVTAPALPPYDSSDERARVLARVVDDVLARTHRRKVHLIAHSQGGVDSRVLVTDLGYADRVASIITISTPHRGTSVADVADVAPDGVLNPAGQLLAWLLGALEGNPPTDATWLADDDVSAAYDPNLAAAIDALRPSTMEAFNASHPDPPGVRIFSVAGVSNLLSTDQPECNDGAWGRTDVRDVVDPFFAASGFYLSNTEGGNVLDPTPNDGLVTVASSRWGVFLGCIAADHPDEIGQIADSGPALVSGFDHRAFYRRLLEVARSTEAFDR
jgi:triacylglycerol lipase